jgi:hypothetical protein
MSYQDDLIDDMESLMTCKSENDLQNDLPLFQPSVVSDPEKRLKVIDVELRKLVEERKSAMEDNNLTISRQGRR